VAIQYLLVRIAFEHMVRKKKSYESFKFIRVTITLSYHVVYPSLRVSLSTSSSTPLACSLQKYLIQPQKLALEPLSPVEAVSSNTSSPFEDLAELSLVAFPLF
jgi:hypothetical protein